MSSSCFQKDRSTLAAIGRGRGQSAAGGCQSPLLDIGFHKDESRLAKIDMENTRAGGTDGGEEVVPHHARVCVLEPFAVPCKEDGACPGSVATADNIALKVDGSIRVSTERRIAVLLAVL